MSHLLMSNGFSVIPSSTNDTINIDLLCSRQIFNVIVSDDPVSTEWLIHHANQVNSTDGIRSIHWFNLLFNWKDDGSNVTIFADEFPNSMIRFNAIPFFQGYWLIPQINRIGFITTVYKRNATDNASLFITLSDNEITMLRKRQKINVDCKRRSSIYNYLMKTY